MEACYLFAFVLETAVCGVLCLVGIAGNTFTGAVLAGDCGEQFSFCPLPLQCLLLVDSLTLWLVWIRNSSPGLAYVSPALRDCTDACAYTRMVTEPLLFLAQCATTWLTLMVLVERWHTIRSKNLNHHFAPQGRRTQRRLAAIFIAATVLMLPKTFDSLVTIRPADNSTQAELLKDNHYYDIIYNNIIVYISVFTLAFLLILYLTIRLFIALCSSNIFTLSSKTDRLTSGGHVSSKSGHVDYDEIVHVTQIAAVIGATYIVSYFPAHALKITQFLQSTRQQYTCGHFQYFLQAFVNFFTCLNAALKFGIMLIFLKRLRHIIRQRYCCMKPRVDYHKELRQIYHCPDGSEMTTILSISEEITPEEPRYRPIVSRDYSDPGPSSRDYDASCSLILGADRDLETEDVV